MDDAALVGFVDAFEDLQRDMDGSGDADSLFFFEEVVERFSLDIFHDDIEVVVVDAGIIELDGIGVDELFDDVGFEEEALSDGFFLMGVQSFERDDAVDADLPCAIDDAMSAA